MDNKLVIGIPTYNRQSSCIETIKNLCSVRGLFEYVEILVVDNSDRDIYLLRDLILQLSDRQHITYTHNGTNIGFDLSILKLVEFAAGKKSRLWFLCDDDTLDLNEVLEYVKALSLSNSVVNVCKFDFGFGSLRPNEGCKNEIGYFLKGDQDDYLRASFLPTLAIDASNVDVTKFSELIGTNYIHLGIINSIIQSVDDIWVYSRVMGLQSENKNLTFSLGDTFIAGYVRCVSFQNVLAISDIRTEAELRCKGYLGGMIRSILAGNNSELTFKDIFSLAKKIIFYLGVGRFLLLAPRLLIVFGFSIYK